MNQLGKLYGISIGTGDPELITVKGLKLLQNAPVVAFPAGIAGKKGIAQQIIAPWLQSHQIQLPLDFPYIHDEEELKQANIAILNRLWQNSILIKFGEIKYLTISKKLMIFK
jgi:precorrin-2/cobalt-factor-2 C20-methyltransferase